MNPLEVYIPFGSHRGSGDINQTSLDYTGQRLDGTGLLYYHARYYDPNLGRFVSPDTIVPGAGALTMGPSSGTGGGPANPQNLNRYTYVTNNPLRYGDPSGHMGACMGDVICSGGKGEFARGAGASGRVTDVGGSGGATVAQAAADAATVVVAAETLAGGSPDAPSAPEAEPTNDGTKQDLYATGNSSGPRSPRIQGNLKPGQNPDIGVDESGNVIPGQGGASTFEKPSQLPTSGHLWKLPAGSPTTDFDDVSDGKPYGPHSAGHHSLVPKRGMTP